MRERLDRADEARILRALEHAVDDVQAGDHPDDAVVKAAGAADLPPGHVRLMVHAFNRGRANTQRKLGESVFDKAAAVSLADAEAVIERLFREPTRAKSAGAAVDPMSDDYAAPPTAWSRDPRLIPDHELLPEPAAGPRPRGALDKRAAVELARVDREVARLSQLAAETAERAAGELSGLETYFRKEGRDWFDACRRQAEAGYGAGGARLFATLAETMDGLRKTAASRSPRAAFVDPTAAPWRQVEGFLKCANEHVRLRREVAALEAAPEVAQLRGRTPAGVAAAVVKAAAGATPSPPGGPLSPPPSPAPSGGGNPAKSFMNRFGSSFADSFSGASAKVLAPIRSQVQAALMPVGDPSESRASREDKAYNELTDPVHELHIQQIQTKAVLHDMLANDPVISSHDPDEVLSHFNDLQRMAPRAVAQPAVLRAVLRKQLAQGQLDTHDLSQIGDIETTLREAREPTRPRDDRRPAPRPPVTRPGSK